MRNVGTYAEEGELFFFSTSCILFGADLAIGDGVTHGRFHCLDTCRYVLLD